FYDAYTLGLGEPTPISAEHGQGMLYLRDAIVAAIGEDRAYPAKEDVAVTDVDIPQTEGEGSDEDEETTYDETKPLRVAIVGRPNAGKST
ncbi:ribosome biogenesis GTPase Der, partial [Rhizobium ruizarguesonis]